MLPVGRSLEIPDVKHSKLYIELTVVDESSRLVCVFLTICVAISIFNIQINRPGSKSCDKKACNVNINLLFEGYFLL